MNGWKIESLILAIGMIVLGCFIKFGLDNFAGKDRVVTVKGLSEAEVMADNVTWPLMYKKVGNDLSQLYNEINNTNNQIKAFLLKKGEQNAVWSKEKTQRQRSARRPYWLYT